MSIMLQSTRRVRSSWSYVSLLVLATALCACAETGATESSNRGDGFQSGDNYVRLIPIEAGAPANSHPFVISADQLHQLLAGIKVDDASLAGRAPVFLEEELQTIVPPLVSALSKAGPNQDVAFAVTSHRGVFGSYSPKSITTGRLFANADSLNVIFGLMQQRVDSGALDYSGVTPAAIPGARSRRLEVGWKIEPGSAHLHEKRGDWLVFDRSAIPPAAVLPSAGSATEAGTIDHKAKEIESRLQVLDELKKRGAITEPEYLERRRAILQEL